MLKGELRRSILPFYQQSDSQVLGKHVGGLLREGWWRREKVSNLDATGKKEDAVIRQFMSNRLGCGCWWLH